jgi:DNA repair ATPase RecN
MSVNVVIPSSPDDRAKVQSALKEISAAMTRIEAERDYINESLGMLQDDFELPKKYMRKVARVYHKQNINEVKNEFSDIEDIYTAVTS